MTRKLVKRSTLFTLIAVVGLLSLGVGYAAWQDSVTINGTVNTASFDVAFDAASWAADEDPNIGTCSVALSGDQDEMTVTYNDGYPGNTCTVTAYLKNFGEAPAQMDGTFTFNGTHVGNQLTISPPSCDWDDADNVLVSGEVTTCVFSVDINEAVSDPNSTYSFTASVNFSTP